MEKERKICIYPKCHPSQALRLFFLRLNTTRCVDWWWRVDMMAKWRHVEVVNAGPGGGELLWGLSCKLQLANLKLTRQNSLVCHFCIVCWHGLVPQVPVCCGVLSSVGVDYGAASSSGSRFEREWCQWWSCSASGYWWSSLRFDIVISSSWAP
jgi:hypothetical protein